MSVSKKMYSVDGDVAVAEKEFIGNLRDGNYDDGDSVAVYILNGAGYYVRSETGTIETVSKLTLHPKKKGEV